MSDLIKFMRLTELSFQNEDLLKEAVTHKTYSEEYKLHCDNQRLEFLGDSVVQIVITKYLFDRYPDLQEGDLSKIRSEMVNQTALSAMARYISLGDFLLLGRGEKKCHGEMRDSTLCDAFEALIGAIYLDKGLDAAGDFFMKQLNRFNPDPVRVLKTMNPRGELQEYFQSRGEKIPEYRMLSETGPAHAKCFEAEVSVGRKVLAAGKGTSKQSAEQNAAKAALAVLGIIR